MSPPTPSSDPAAHGPDAQRHALLTDLTTIAGRTQLLQRRVQRCTGLTDLERTAMLDGLAVTLTTVRHLVNGLP